MTNPHISYATLAEVERLMAQPTRTVRQIFWLVDTALPEAIREIRRLRAENAELRERVNQSDKESDTYGEEPIRSFRKESTNDRP